MLIGSYPALLSDTSLMRYYLVLSNEHLYEIALGLLKANVEADYYDGQAAPIVASGNGREAWLFLQRHHNDYFLDSFENIKNIEGLVEKLSEKHCRLCGKDEPCYCDSVYDI